jgi:hypothetical protein
MRNEGARACPQIMLRNRPHQRLRRRCASEEERDHVTVVTDVTVIPVSYPGYAAVSLVKDAPAKDRPREEDRPPPSRRSLAYPISSPPKNLEKLKQ